MHSNENLIELVEAPVRIVPRSTVYHETAIEPLVKPPDFTYLLHQLDENEFLGTMKTKRIIRYSHRPDYTAVETYTFSEEVSLPNTLGRIEGLIPESAKPKLYHTVEQIEPIISSAGILMISRQLGPHDVVVIPAPAKHCLSDIVIDSSCSVNLLLGRDELLYWFTMGHSGIFKMTAKVIKDEENFLAKLKAGLDDVPTREYLVQRSLADSKVTLDYVTRVPDRMDHIQAAEYLGVKPISLYTMVDDGRIPVRKAGRKNQYLKEDLDAYLNRTTKPRHR